MLAIGWGIFQVHLLFLLDILTYVAVHELVVKICSDEARFDLDVLKEAFDGSEKGCLQVLKRVDIFVAAVTIDEQQSVFETTDRGSWSVSNVHMPEITVVFTWRLGNCVFLH